LERIDLYRLRCKTKVSDAAANSCAPERTNRTIPEQPLASSGVLLASEDRPRGITIGFVDFAVLFQSDRGRCASGRFWCETGAVRPARADEPGLTSVDIHRRTFFTMIIKRIDLAISRLKQGFDST
jgi:hypothetical protein